MSEQVPPPSDTSSPKTGRRTRANCLGQILTTLLLIIVGVALAIAGVAALAFYVFGFTPETPAQAARAQNDVQVLQQQNSALQTQVADLTNRSDSSRELLQDLDKQVRGLGNVSDQIRQYDSVAATIQVESHDSRTAVAAYSSAMATRVAQIDDIQRRTDRITRFLQRLSDISGDTVNDLGGPNGSATVASTETAVATIAPPPSPTSTTTPTPTVSNTPVEPTVPTGVATSSPEVLPTVRLAASATPGARTTATP